MTAVPRPMCYGLTTIRDLADAVHGFHRAMAALTLHAGTNMGPMIETGIGGEVMDFHPRNRLRSLCRVRFQLAIQAQRVVELLQFRRDDRPRGSPGFAGLEYFGKDGLRRSRHVPMTGHAHRGRRDPGVAADLGTEMTVDTGDLAVPRVQPM